MLLCKTIPLDGGKFHDERSLIWKDLRSLALSKKVLVRKFLILIVIDSVFYTVWAMAVFFIDR